MPGSLFVVATPIGNLDDITIRALDKLKTVAQIAAEDTRRTANLLRHFGITTPTTSLHQHNEQRKLPYLLRLLAAGSDIALVSDAGTPLVADPGQRLIAAAISQGVPVIPIPGPSAVLAALTVSGLQVDEFVFAGFVPSRSKDRLSWLARFIGEDRSVVFFETPHRIQRLLEDISRVLVDRPIIIARELTKLHEQVIRTTTRVAPSLDIPQRGEFTIVLGATPKNHDTHQPPADSAIYDYFYQMTETEGLGRRPAIVQTAHHFGLSTKRVFSALEQVKNSTAP